MLDNKRSRLNSASFLCFVIGFSLGFCLTLFNQPKVQHIIVFKDLSTARNHEPLLLMAVLILSAPNNFDFRDTIRNTWLRLNPNHNSTRHVFAIGAQGLDEETLGKLHEENTNQNDLIFLPIHDSYANLTLKLKESLLHLHSSMPSKYVFKLDDNSFARLDVIVEELESREATRSSSPDLHQKCYYWGYFSGKNKVLRAGKWKETEYNLSPWYLPYASGGGYVLSKACVDFIVQNRNVIRGYANEDATVGTWLSVLPTEKRHDTRFDTEYVSHGCSNRFIVQHAISQAIMVQRYQSLVEQNKLCPLEYEKYQSYEYDWTVPPFQCCKRNRTIF